MASRVHRTRIRAIIGAIAALLLATSAVVARDAEAKGEKKRKSISTLRKEATAHELDEWPGRAYAAYLEIRERTRATPDLEVDLTRCAIDCYAFRKARSHAESGLSLASATLKAGVKSKLRRRKLERSKKYLSDALAWTTSQIAKEKEIKQRVTMELVPAVLALSAARASKQSLKTYFLPTSELRETFRTKGLYAIYANDVVTMSLIYQTRAEADRRFSALEHLCNNAARKWTASRARPDASAIAGSTTAAWGDAARSTEPKEDGHNSMIRGLRWGFPLRKKAETLWPAKAQIAFLHLNTFSASERPDLLLQGFKGSVFVVRLGMDTTALAP